MRGMDLALGTRLHGNMAAIAAGTPGVIIAHDSRTGELGQTMHLPHLDFEAAMAAPDLATALEAVKFDGAAFDAWRAATARRLCAVFDRLAIPVSGHVQRLAG
jgi:polysaccharide pyruvyl transferase WcaK-like protein